jgi:DNA sulfur modification protein DndE
MRKPESAVSGRPRPDATAGAAPNPGRIPSRRRGRKDSAAAGTASLVFLLCALSVSSPGPEKAAVLHLIGDSTMADKPNPDQNPEQGWGQALSRFFSDTVLIRNHAVNGRSTKSFIREGRWDSVLAAIKPGDYLFIQFGHNDEKSYDSSRYAEPRTVFRANLIRFVSESRSKGAIPVLFTPIVRRKFDDSDALVDTHGEYPDAVRRVAEERSVPLVDLERASADLVRSLGPEASKSLYLWIRPGASPMFPDGKQDDTHFSRAGAMEMARLAVDGLKENNLDIVRFLKTGFPDDREKGK